MGPAAWALDRYEVWMSDCYLVTFIWNRLVTWMPIAWELAHSCPLMGFISHISYKLLKQMRCDFSFLWQHLELCHVMDIYIHTHTHTYIYIYIYDLSIHIARWSLDYIYICVNIYIDYIYYAKCLYFKLIEICLTYLLLHCTKVMQVDSILEIQKFTMAVSPLRVFILNIQYFLMAIIKVSVKFN